MLWTLLDNNNKDNQVNIISKKDFLKINKRTVYSEYRPSYFEGLYIKEENTQDNNDFFYRELLCEVDAENCSEHMCILDRAEAEIVSIRKWDDRRLAYDIRSIPSYNFFSAIVSKLITSH